MRGEGVIWEREGVMCGRGDMGGEGVMCGRG